MHLRLLQFEHVVRMKDQFKSQNIFQNQTPKISEEQTTPVLIGIDSVAFAFRQCFYDDCRCVCRGCHVPGHGVR